MRNGKARARGSAFSLVELLVAMAIVALLMAILLPVLGRAREHAQRVKCAANLRSIGHALTMYTQQYAHYPGMVVQEVNGLSVRDVAVWPARLRPFLGGEKGAFHCPSRDERFQWSDAGPVPLLRAQPASRFVSFGYQAGEPLVHFDAYFSYGYNGFGRTGVSIGSVLDGTHKGLGAVIAVTDHQMYRELAASRVKVPEDMVAVTDSNADGVMDYGTKPDAGFARHAHPGRVHGGGANVLFCDGHVTWYRQEDLLVTDRRDAAQWPKIRRWNNDHGLGE